MINDNGSFALNFSPTHQTFLSYLTRLVTLTHSGLTTSQAKNRCFVYHEYTYTFPLQLCLHIIKTCLQTLLRRKATGEKGPATRVKPGTYTLLWSFSHELSVPVTNLPPEQCLHINLYNVSTCLQRTCTSMARHRQLTPSTTGSRVHATCCCPLSPLPSHTVPALRHRSSSGRCIAAYLRSVHKAMGDEGFAAGTDSSWVKLRDRV